MSGTSRVFLVYTGRPTSSYNNTRIIRSAHKNKQEDLKQFSLSDDVITVRGISRTTTLKNKIRPATIKGDVWLQ